MALLVLLVFFLLYWFLLRFAQMQYTKRFAAMTQQAVCLLPSPPRMPVIGHLHLLVGVLPHVALRDLAARHGRDGFLLIHLGAVPTLIVSSPSAAKAVLHTHDHLLASRPRSAVAHALFKSSVDVAFAIYGERWRQAKKLLTTHLLTVKKVQSYRPAREEVVRFAISRVGDAARAGEALDMSDLLYAMTSDVMCGVVSRSFLKLEGRSKLFQELHNSTAALVGGANLEDFFPSILQVKIFRTIVSFKAARLRKKWDLLLDKVIEDHENEGCHQEKTGFLEALLAKKQEHGLTTDCIKALLIDTFFGGTDTSYLVLESLMMELMKNPLVMSKVQLELRSVIPKNQELVTEDDLKNLIYLKAAIKEALRLHPPAPLLAPHLSMENLQIQGYMIPAQIPVIVNGWALGRDTNVWEDAEEFKPERFISMDDGKAVSYEGHDYQFLPFGAGRRMCPGMNLAISTVEIMSANLLRSFNWEVPKGMEKACANMKEMLYLTIHRQGHLLLVPSAYGSH